MISVARGTAVIIRLRARSRASERSRDLTIGSPSDCLSSSLTSCLVMRRSCRQWKRDQTRSTAAISPMTKTIDTSMSIGDAADDEAESDRVGDHAGQQLAVVLATA